MSFFDSSVPHRYFYFLRVTFASSFHYLYLFSVQDARDGGWLRLLLGFVGAWSSRGDVCVHPEPEPDQVLQPVLDGRAAVCRTQGAADCRVHAELVGRDWGCLEKILQERQT